MSWVVRVPDGQRRWILRWRLHGGIEVLESAGELWLRGDASSERIAVELGTLPGAERYTCRADGALVPVGSLLGTARAPELGWKALSTWGPELPVVIYPGAAERFTLRLRPTARERPSDVLRCAWSDWRDWCETAPAHRLGRLRFAATRDGLALVLGEPLPPLAGQRYSLIGLLAMPAGWGVDPALDADDLRHVLATADGDLVIADPERDWEPVPIAAIVAASRAAVRLTAEALRA